MHRLLIVDDEKHVIDSLSDLFREQTGIDVEVHTAVNGYDALKIMESVPVDVVLLDIRMPGLSGIDVYDKINAFLPSCRVIFLTGYSNFEYIYHIVNNKNVMYLLKTETNDKIIAVVKDALSDIEAEQQMQKNNDNATVSSAIFRSVEKAPDGTGFNSQSRLVNMIKGYVKQNISGNLSLIRISNYFNYNSAYVSRIFKKLTGVNLSTYIMHIRIEKAKELLSYTNDSIKSIAEKTGFHTPHYFSRVFKEATGVSPKEYKINH